MNFMKEILRRNFTTVIVFILIGSTISVLLLLLSNASPGPQIAGPEKGKKPPKEVGEIFQSSVEAWLDFSNPEQVTILGYDGYAAEPGISKDGTLLLWNDSESPSPPNKDIHWATRVDDITFQYQGKVSNINTDLVDGTPSFDTDGNLYYTSQATYFTDFKSMYSGVFDVASGTVLAPQVLEGDIYVGAVGWVSVDPEISPDGNDLYYSEGFWEGSSLPNPFQVRHAVKNGDLYIQDNSTLVNIDSTNLRYAPAISSDGLELFFTEIPMVGGSPDIGNNGIYRARRNTTSEPFSVPKRIGAITSFAEAPTITQDGSTMYFHKKVGSEMKIFRVTRELISGNELFSDSFEVSEWNGLWVEDGQDDWFRSSHRSIDGSYAAEIDGPATNAGLTSNDINLRWNSDVTVAFSWFIEKGFDSGEYLAFDVSTDGGSSWQEMARLKGNVDVENIWHHENFDLLGINSLKLRFRGTASRFNEDAHVDNVLVVGIGGTPEPPETQVFDCTANTPDCPSIEIAGDERPDAVEGITTFRGYADPSLRTDPVTGELWLSYTKVENQAGLFTHLAKSSDGGNSWEFVRTINAPEFVVFEGDNYKSSYEVSTFTPSANGSWYYTWIYYLRDKNGRPPRSIKFDVTSASSLSQIPNSPRIFVGGNAMSSEYQPQVNLSMVPGAPNCAVWTEPSLLEQYGVLYLLAECVHNEYSIFSAIPGADAKDLDWRYVGQIENIAPEVHSDAEFMTQGDVAMAKDGSLLYIFTPTSLIEGGDIHYGCYVAELESLANPTIMRISSGEPLLRAIITDSSAGPLGPGACGYDKNSDSGIVFIRREFDLANKDVRFFMHATGIHP